jgi:sugar phosphate isomerase/epimerase
MKLACADFTFPLLTHDKSLDLIAGLGMDGVDIGLFDQRSHLEPSREFKNPVANARALRRKLTDRGLACADVFLQCAPDFVSYAVNHPEKARRKKASDWFRKTLEYAKEAGSRHITCLPGVEFRDAEKPADSFRRAADELAWRVAEAAAAGLVFSVEAHIGSLAPTPEKALNLVRAVPGLTLTLDYTHFTRAGMADSRIEPLCAHASHIHVRGGRKGRLQTPFKDNAIDYARVLAALRKAGYQGWLGIEYVWVDWEHCNECDNVSETILFRDFLRKQNARRR